jgi:uncharacterized protein (TIGR00369 family)
MPDEDLTPKCVSESRIVLNMLMNPEHANPLGNVHGGVIMKLVDEAGGLAAMRHARSMVVTVAIDSMTFDEPIYVGSMAEDPLTGSRIHTNLAYLVYVAIDSQGRPHPVPPLCVETPEEELRFEQAKERQVARKERQKREQQAAQSHRQA